MLDKSKPDAPHYDILFFDRNADGDLTGADERIEGKIENGETTFIIGSFTDPVSWQTHTGLSIRRTEGENSITMLRIKSCDKVSIPGRVCHRNRAGRTRSLLPRRPMHDSGRGPTAHSASSSG